MWLIPDLVLTAGVSVERCRFKLVWRVIVNDPVFTERDSQSFCLSAVTNNLKVSVCRLVTYVARVTAPLLTAFFMFLCFGM